MSIYCSRTSLGKDSFDPDESVGRVVAYPGNNLARIDAKHWPDGWAGTAHIPHWCDPRYDDCCKRGGGCQQEGDAPLAPWLRLEMGHDGAHLFVLIDEDAARALAADLIEWADSPKTRSAS